MPKITLFNETNLSKNTFLEPKAMNAHFTNQMKKQANINYCANWYVRAV